MTQWKEVPVRRGEAMVNWLFQLCEQHGAYIAGGFVRWMCSPVEDTAKPHDVDIFPKTWRAYYALEDALGKAGYTCDYTGAVAQTWQYERLTPHNDHETLLHRFRQELNIIQLILPDTLPGAVSNAPLDKVLECFDFSIVRIGLTSAKTALADHQFEEDETCKRLRVRYINFPVGLVMRMTKYAARGYQPTVADIGMAFRGWDAMDADLRKQATAFLKDAQHLTAEQLQRDETFLRFAVKLVGD